MQGRGLTRAIETLEAAAAEISQRDFIESGDLQPTPRTWANAQTFASLNTASLAQYGIAAFVTGIQVDAAADTVLVTVTADVSGLFPSVLPRVLISESAQARVRGVGGGG